jgi:hypothetical protein
MPRFRVPCGVAQALDCDAIGRDLYRRRQARQSVWRLHLRQQRANLIVVCRLFAQRRHQSKLIQRRRTQIIHEPPDLANGKLRLALDLHHQFVRGGRVTLNQIVYRVQLQGQVPQRRSQPIVQVAPQAPSLLLARQHQPLA